MQPDGRLDRAELRRLGRHDQVAGERDLQSAADDRCRARAATIGMRQLVEGAQHLPDRPAERAVAAPGGGHHVVQVGAGREVPQAAAQHRRTRA